jgi:hydroxymethylglutaryl-CoA reductase (NADPH)
VSSFLSAATDTETAKTGEVIENFMSSWTTLVGDPVMSKWIVVVLGMSVALNGFLLKGIAAAGSGLPIVRGSVRFRSRARVSEKAEEDFCEPIHPVVAMPSIGPVVAPPAPAPVPEPSPAPAVLDAPVKVSKPPVLSIPIDLTTVDARLEKERLHAEALARSERARNEPTRSLDDIVDIFENGPRPVSASLSLLTDEEVIILAQSGKIAAYALEKMLGDFERAVAIRRALICV